MFRPRRVWTLLNDQRIVAIYAQRERAEAAGHPVESILVPKVIWDPIYRLLHRWLGYRDMGIMAGPLGTVTWQDVVDAEGPARRAVAMAGRPPAQLESPVAAMTSTHQLMQQLMDDRLDLQDQVRELTKEVASLKSRKRTRVPMNTPADIRSTLAYRDAGVWQGKDPVHAFRAGLEYAAQFFINLSHASTR